MKKHVTHLSFHQPRHLSYDVEIGVGLLRRLPQRLRRLPRAHTYVIITDQRVRRLYGKRLLHDMRQAGYTAHLIAMSAGEKHKNQNTKTWIEHELLKKRCGRDTMIVALGGGVVGDMAGFVAATFMRGVPYIQIPTTLLAMVDSAVGGKTGIDTSYGKNLIGAIWQPCHVMMDVDMLQDLPDREFRNGLFEAAKMFTTHNPHLFRLLEKKLDHIFGRYPALLARLVGAAVRIKANVVTRDEREGGERMSMNFGHTIGHALEYISEYTLPHGYAVGVGVVVESRIAVEMSILPLPVFARIWQLFRAIGADIDVLRRYKNNDIIRATMTDKKVRQGKPQYVLLQDIGVVYKGDNHFVHPVSPPVIRRAIDACLHYGQQ